MKLSEFKKQLNAFNDVRFIEPNGIAVPIHFHITEVGLTTKNFIDCGGTVREEKVVNFQLWEAGDFEHRLTPGKLLDIISLSEKTIGIGDHEVEVEYQTTTIGRYGVDAINEAFVLVAKKTNCLATDKCGIPAEKVKRNLSELAPVTNSCSSDGKCC